MTSIPMNPVKHFVAMLAVGVMVLHAAPSAAEDAAKLLPGVWQFEQIDKETGVREITRIEFRSDGSYQARMQASPFKASKAGGSGRYSIKPIDAQQFQLSVKREIGDPTAEADADEAGDSERITVVDAQTLRAADGSIIHRIK